MAGRRGHLPTAILLALASVGPLGYPLWLAARSARYRRPSPPEPAAWPDLTVVVPAYREHAVIARKVSDLRDNGYPGRLRIVAVADDEQTAVAARLTDAQVLTSGQRLGKAEAINRGVAACEDAIVVLSDANTVLEPGSLCALVRWFERPEIGAVAGEKQVIGASQGYYWRFESWLKRREWRRGSTVGLVGELAAIRRALYRPLPADLVVDDLWLGLDIIEQGVRVAYEPTAIAMEDPSANWRDEWERRTRVVCGVLDVLWRRRALLRPGGSPVWSELWGHRLVRSSLGPLAHVLLLLVALRNAPRSGAARWFLAAHVLGGVAVVRGVRGTDLSRPEQLAFQILFLQGVAIGGLIRFAVGDRPALWPKQERSAVTPAPRPGAGRAAGRGA